MARSTESESNESLGCKRKASTKRGKPSEAENKKNRGTPGSMHAESLAVVDQEKGKRKK